MIIKNETKERIIEEYNQFKEKMYANKTLEERKELDQFFTPPEITIKMLEELNCDDISNKKILDPTSGSGNILVTCLLAGAKPENLYGNDYDKNMVDLCRKRIIDGCKKYNIDYSNFKDYQIHRGNALQKFCLNYFEEDYDQIYNFNKIDDLSYDPDDGVKEELW